MDVILSQVQNSREGFAMMHLDLDFFKQVNDTMGHAAGDLVLQETARILLEETRGGDSAVRFGGDEFVLIFPNLTCRDQLANIAKRILVELEKPIPFEDEFCRISGSIGIAISTDYHDVDSERMLLDADLALYASKNAGRAQYTFVTDIPENIDDLDLTAKSA